MCKYIWGNPNPTLAFEAKTIPWTDIAGGDTGNGIFLVMFYFARDIAYAVSTVVVRGGFGRACTEMDTNNHLIRTFYINDYGFAMDNCFISPVSGTPVANNNYLIPIQIMRIK